MNVKLNFNIGDYVSIPEAGIVAPIIAIAEGRFQIDNKNVDLDDSDTWFTMDSAEPVFLDELVIEKLGFKYNNKMKGYMMNYKRDGEKTGEGRIVLRYEIIFRKWSFSVGRKEDIVVLNVIRYLHELQRGIQAITLDSLEINLL